MEPIGRWQMARNGVEEGLAWLLEAHDRLQAGIDRALQPVCEALVDLMFDLEDVFLWFIPDPFTSGLHILPNSV